MRARFLTTLLLVSATASSLQAQRRVATFEQDTTGRDVRFAWRPLRIAKWTTVLVSAGAAGYGFSENRAADREYEELERICEGNPSLCEKNAGSDEYADAALEERYQRIVDRDDRARLALLAGQLGIAASVVLFILDLPDQSTPEDIPYDPKPLRFGLSRDGGVAIAFRWRGPNF
jgi:hypothetical protein